MLNHYSFNNLQYKCIEIKHLFALLITSISEKYDICCTTVIENEENAKYNTHILHIFKILCKWLFETGSIFFLLNKLFDD